MRRAQSTWDFRSRARLLSKRAFGRLDPGFVDRNVIFIHIPKAAGTAISYHIYDHKVGHWRIADCLAIDPQTTRACVSFAFVRDPQSRFLSAFNFLKAGGANAKDARFAQKYIGQRSACDFAQALEQERVIQRKVHFRPQALFVTTPDEPERIAVDWIGKFENLTQDFATIASRIGVDAHLPVRNAGPKTSPAVHDAALAVILRRIYAIDYQLFGY